MHQEPTFTRSTVESKLSHAEIKPTQAIKIVGAKWCIKNGYHSSDLDFLNSSIDKGWMDEDLEDTVDTSAMRLPPERIELLKKFQRVLISEGLVDLPLSNEDTSGSDVNEESVRIVSEEEAFDENMSIRAEFNDIIEVYLGKFSDDEMFDEVLPVLSQTLGLVKSQGFNYENLLTAFQNALNLESEGSKAKPILVDFTSNILDKKDFFSRLSEKKYAEFFGSFGF